MSFYQSVDPLSISDEKIVADEGESDRSSSNKFDVEASDSDTVQNIVQSTRKTRSEEIVVVSVTRIEL